MYFSSDQTPAHRSIDKLSTAVSWDLMMHSALSDVKHPGFNERLRRYQAKENSSEIFFESDNHRQLFRKAAERLRNDRPHMLAVMYLLTANRTLWSRICHRMIPAELSFDNDQLGKVNIVAYTLYSFAKDLHIGSQHITVDDMIDPTTIPDKLFALICNAVTIHQFGVGALSFLPDNPQ